jgi:hypothetical protein
MKHIFLDWFTRLAEAGTMIPFFLWSKKCNPDGSANISLTPNIIRIVEGVMIAVITAVLTVVATTWIMAANLQIQQKNAEDDIIEHNIRMKNMEDRLNTLCTLVGVINERQQERIRRESLGSMKHHGR